MRWHIVCKEVDAGCDDMCEGNVEVEVESRLMTKFRMRLEEDDPRVRLHG